VNAVKCLVTLFFVELFKARATDRICKRNEALTTQELELFKARATHPIVMGKSKRLFK
jgi:hypothetical protein